jgi:glycosyltransferase involved in cell wall biosynthesis
MTETAPFGSSPTLSVIVPTYRGGARIYSNLVKLDHALAAIGLTYEIIVVSDGDSDNTPDEVRRLEAPHVRVYHYTRNMGKGFALRYGVARSHGEVVTMIDGDGDIDPVQIATYLAIMRETNADIVIASKRHPDSKVVYPPLRRLYSAAYQALLRVLFHLEVRDTQVGLKLFRREVLVAVLPRIVVKRYAFDLELLVVAHHLGFTRVVEAPVAIGQRFSSTINRHAIKSILLETAAIFYRRNIVHYYDARHDVITFDALPSATEAELAALADDQRIMRTVLLSLKLTVEHIALAYRPRLHAPALSRRRGHDMNERERVASAIEEERWRASM